MPDDEGRLSKVEEDEINEWLAQWKESGGGICPWSGHTDWYLIGHVVYPLSYSKKLIGRGPAYPQVMIACTECGYTMYFNATKIGITEWHGRKDHEKS